MATLLPAWKDLVIRQYAVGTGTLTYSLKDGENIIFTGRSHNVSDTNTYTIPFSSIARDYVDARITLDLSKTVQDEVPYSRTITVLGISPTREYLIYNDYSYEERELPTDVGIILSQPLSNIVDPRQYLFCTEAVFLENLTMWTAEVNMGRNTIDEAEVENCATFTIPLSNYDTLSNEVIIVDPQAHNPARYIMQKTNADYCLYYLNAYGGYDHLLIKGNSLMSESYTRTEVRRNELNTTLKHNRDIIATDISRKWQLHTDYLSDDQWALTHHLLGSPHIFLHNLNTGEVMPVIITAHQADWKTYRNQGNRKSNLTIEVEEARTRVRR